MKPFEYIETHSAEEACAVLAEYGSDARIIAGGTDLLIELRRPLVKKPRIIVDISYIDDLRTINIVDGSIGLKSLATHNQIMHSDVLHKFAPLLPSAAAMIGSPQIRNRGTVGGNVMNAAACADTVPPLIALGALVTLRSNSGSRQLNLEDLFIKPYQTKARPDEILTEIRFPVLAPDMKSSFVKLGRRNALAVSRLSVAAVLARDKTGKITAARIVPGAAFTTWRRVPEAEQMLLSQNPSNGLFEAAGRKVSELMIASAGRRWSTEYKEPVLAVLVRKSLERCV